MSSSNLSSLTYVTADNHNAHNQVKVNSKLKQRNSSMSANNDSRSLQLGIAMPPASITTRQLIDLKFDQLANKVFTELTIAHNSLQLFQSIDNILMEQPQFPVVMTSSSMSLINQKQQQHHSRIGGSSSPHQQQQFSARINSHGGSSGHLTQLSHTNSANFISNGRRTVTPLHQSSFRSSTIDDDDNDDDFSVEEIDTSGDSGSLQLGSLKMQQVQSIERHHKLSQAPNKQSKKVASPSSDSTYKRNNNHSPGAAVSGTHDSLTDNTNLSQSPYSLTKSKTTSNATNCNDLFPNHSYQNHLQQQKQPKHLNNTCTHSNKRLNPIVRSSTIGTTFDKGRLRQIYPSNQQPRSIHNFNTKDMGALYKPHLNYSTNVLGHHRLSDDDEIIIVPTNQNPTSPSLTSLSPDMPDSTNDDEPQERFSISRTKSFWERLANTKSNQCKPILSSY